MSDKIQKNKLHGSRLLYELSKLKESSQEAVENSKEFSSFKEYLHVEHPIQNELISILKNVSDKDKGQLILLSGSVGDGKSHLLAYLNKEYPELMKKFNVHNDATESFNPQENSIDTLAKVLEPFSDKLLKQSKNKQILAINLGVLHNFINSSYAKRFTKLKKFIKESGVFDKNKILKNNRTNDFKLISFTDYQPYQLTKNGVKSDYIMNILRKIVDENDDNPFYQAYLEDKKDNINKIIIQNYELLKIKKVCEKITSLIIKAIIKYKIFASTRTILNFIYDILVPTGIDNLEKSDRTRDKLSSLLTNILFESKDRSRLLKVMSKLDPINTRLEKIDNILIEFNNKNDLSNLYNYYLNNKSLINLLNSLEEKKSTNEFDVSDRMLLYKTFIRLCYFLSEEISKLFKEKEKIYEEYLKYLYAYNAGSSKGLVDLYRKIKEAIFEWKGSPKSDYIYIEKFFGKIKIAQELKLKPYIEHLETRNKEVFFRFEDVIKVVYRVSNNKNSPIELELDYSLFKKIEKILAGYRPNKKDKEDAIQFVEFIDKLMKYGGMNEELLIYHVVNKNFYTLKYEMSFEQFTFARENYEI